MSPAYANSQNSQAQALRNERGEMGKGDGNRSRGVLSQSNGETVPPPVLR